MPITKGYPKKTRKDMPMDKKDKMREDEMMMMAKKRKGAGKKKKK